MRIFSLSALAILLGACTYDSTPPGDEKINDGKPLLMIDATGLSANRQVQIKYTDTAGATTLETSAEKTDGAGRFLYPLYMTRGTRTYTITSIIVDQGGDGIGAGTDKTYGPQSAAFVSDSEIKSLKLTAANFIP